LKRAQIGVINKLQAINQKRGSKGWHDNNNDDDNDNVDGDLALSKGLQGVSALRETMTNLRQV